jgi:predicted RNase H-like nuclease (RuvC/YqgF family)
MANLPVLVDGIEDKILKIISINKKLKFEYEQKINEINTLKANLAEQEKLIQALENKLEIVKTARSLESKEGAVEAKAKINDLLREIDKCIGLLNV